MAPFRRKAAGKAAAAAAAAAKWKAGDLVLAKMKGFPAWPAVISEPEHWGYSPESKKVLVFFFGTEQIAFCNPADLEAFTKEKKESILRKRHGKGADFTRAVREIIDTYEKSKKHDQLNVNISEQVSLTNTSKSEECAASSGSRGEVNVATIDSCSKLSDPKSNGEQSILCEVSAVTKHDDRDTTVEEPRGILLVEKNVLPSTYSRRKCNSNQTQSYVVKRRAPSAPRSRGSTRASIHRFQDFTLLSSNSDKSNWKLSAHVLRDGVRRDRCVRRSPDASDGDNSDSPPCISAASPLENCSDDVTIESDTQSDSFEDITVCSDGESLQSESSAECDEDFKMSQRLDFQEEAVIVRKKRNPIRKHPSNSATGFLDRTRKLTGFGAEINENGQRFSTEREMSSEIYSKEDGDDAHLPLVKRARVRMSRILSTGEELDSMGKIEKPTVASSSKIEQESVAIIDSENCTAMKSFDVQGVEDNSFSPSKCTENSKPPLWEANKDLHFSSLADGEAALPPSKRLRRALLAMSANAAVDRETPSEAQSAMNTVINDTLSPAREYSDISVKCDPLHVVCTDLEPSDTHEKLRPDDEGADCKETSKGLGNSLDVIREDMVAEFVASCGVNDHSTVETPIVALKCSSPNVGGNHCLMEGNLGPTESMLPIKDEFNNESSEACKPCKEDSSDISRAISSPESGNFEAESGSLSSDVKCADFSVLSSDDRSLDSAMPEVFKEISPDVKNVDRAQISVEILKPSVQSQEYVDSTSLSEESLSHKTMSGTLTSSPTPIDGLDSTARASPPNTSSCKICTAENSNFLENNICCSHDFLLDNGKLQHVGKWSKTEAKAVISSFKSSIETLTGTKRRIDRATRIAMSCAKFGSASKVIKIIACSLEGEPNLRRRVDLFFLVDSIAQCSRSQKGDVGGLYLSSIKLMLPRLLLAAAPPGDSARENRSQCLKVLKVWLDRRILPEPILRQHIRNLESFSSTPSTKTHRPLRMERPINDQGREVEGMPVNKRGSNSSVQLSGPLMSSIMKKGVGKSDSAVGYVDAEHNCDIPETAKRFPTSIVGESRHIPGDVVSEVEVKDVFPSVECELNVTCPFVTSLPSYVSPSPFAGSLPQPPTRPSHHPQTVISPLPQPSLPRPATVSQPVPPQPSLPTPLGVPPLPPCQTPISSPPPPSAVLPPPPSPHSLLPPMAVPPPPQPQPSLRLPPAVAPLPSFPPPPPALTPPRPSLAPPPALTPPRLSLAPQPAPTPLLPSLLPPPPPLPRPSQTPPPPIHLPSLPLPPALPSRPTLLSSLPPSPAVGPRTPSRPCPSPPSALPPPPPLQPPLPPTAVHDSSSKSVDPKFHLHSQNGKEDLQHSNAQPVNYQAHRYRDLPVEAQNVKEDLRHSNAQSVNYQAHRYRDLPVEAQVPVPFPHGPPISAVNNAQLRPPHPSPSTQFSYIGPDQCPKEIPPPSYPNRFHFVNGTDTGNFHSDHERMNLAPQDENRGFSASPFSGRPCYAVTTKVACAPNSSLVPSSEPKVSSHRWPIPPRPLNHIEIVPPHRPPFGVPIPVAMRASNSWRPR